MAVAAPSATHQPSPRSDHRRALREAFVAGAAALVVLFVSVYGLWGAAQRTAREQVSTELARLAGTMSSLVDPALHQTLRDSSQMDTPPYERAIAALRRARLATPGVKYVYTVIRDGDKVRFILDTAEPGDHDHDGREDRSSIGEVYPDPDPEMLIALGSPGAPGRPSASTTPYTDAWGTFISGYAPVYDAQHRQIAAVGVDIDARHYLGDEASRRRATLLGLAPAAVLMLFLCFGVYHLRRTQLSSAERAQSAAQQAADATELFATQERRTRSIIEGTGVVSWEFDPDSDRLTYVSPQIAITGYAPAEWMTPGFWRRAVHPEHVDAVARFLHRDADDDANNRVEVPIVTASRRTMWAELVISTEESSSTRGGLTGVLIDVTEARRLREAAEAASRSKSEFLANMSHEIRTPLTAILGYAELLREDGDAGAAPRSRLQTIDTIRSAGQYLLAVINDILDLSKIEAGRMTVETVAVELPALLVECETLLRPRADAKGLSLHLVLDTPIPSRAITDPTRLRQVIFNLVGNAIKFTAEGGVTLRVGVDDPEAAVQALRIDVVDTGPGLTAEQSSRLFHAFSQADTSVTRTHGGTGLGLTISRRLASLMGGDVTLVETTPGRGSTFRLEIEVISAGDSEPVTSLRAAGEAEAARAPEAPIRLAGRVLVAEDNPVNQRLIEVFLRKAGATIVVADNGARALEKLDAAVAAGEPFDLLVSDMQMPEMDGYTLVRTLRARGDALPVVALTANAMADDRQQCLDAGCDDYATKPVDLPALLKVCARWIDARQMAEVA